MKIGLYGTCHVHALALAFRQLLPDAQVVAHEAQIVHFRGNAEAVGTELRSCDILLASQLPPGFPFPTLATLGAERQDSSLLALPVLRFIGFHPDCRFLHRGEAVRSPLQFYHSVIVAAAHAIGLDEEQIVPLFRDQVFARLGYHTAFATAQAELLKNCAAVGLDFGPSLDRLVRRGAFMHTINHPRAAFLGEVAWLFGTRLGLVEATTPPPVPAEDPLARHSQWPVYPEIAARLGIGGGSYRFLGPLTGTRRQELDLPAFVGESLAIYRRLGSKGFGLPILQRAERVIRRLV